MAVATTHFTGFHKSRIYRGHKVTFDRSPLGYKIIVRNPRGKRILRAEAASSYWLYAMAVDLIKRG